MVVVALRSSVLPPVAALSLVLALGACSAQPEASFPTPGDGADGAGAGGVGA